MTELSRPPHPHNSPPHSMTTRAHLLVYAVALAALLALAHAQELCDSMQIGNETELAVRLPERRVEPDMFTMEISEPNVCSDSDAVGLKVMACDTEKAPRVYLLDTTRGMVIREGNVDTAANVYITVYCGSESDEASDESVESPIISNRFYEEALLPSSSIPSPPLPSSSTVGSTSTSPQPLPNSIPDSPQQLGGEPTSVLTSSKEEYLSPVQLESRFSSLDQSKGSSLPMSPSSRLKYLWKERATPSRESSKSQPFIQGTSSRFQENQPSIFDSQSLPFTALPKWPQDPSSPLPDKRPLPQAKRLAALRPKQPLQWLANRSPAWMKRPTRRPSSPWRRSVPKGETRKLMSRSRNNPMSQLSGNGDSWSPYDEDSLSPHWSEERIDPNPWYIEGEPQSPQSPQSQSHNANHAPMSWRTKHVQANNYPSPSSIKLISKKQTRYVPPIHEEDPVLLAELKKALYRSPRPSLPKLLLLLQDQDHPSLMQRKCASVHSVEDAEPWWSKEHGHKENADEDLPWEPDYPTDYSADDGGSRAQTPGLHADDREQTSHVVSAYKDEPRCSLCSPEHSIEARKPSRVQHSPQRISDAEPSPQGAPHPPHESFLYYSPTPLTERPLVTSTVHHSIAWLKGSKSATAMKLKQASSMAGELSEHHTPLGAWNFLSQLLLSHPSFRDSTHVIRIR